MSSSIALVRSPLYALGIVIALISWARTRHYDPSTLAVYVGALSVIGAMIAARSGRGTTLAVTAGLLWAASDTYWPCGCWHLPS